MFVLGGLGVSFALFIFFLAIFIQVTINRQQLAVIVVKSGASDGEDLILGDWSFFIGAYPTTVQESVNFMDRNTESKFGPYLKLSSGEVLAEGQNKQIRVYDAQLNKQMEFQSGGNSRALIEVQGTICTTASRDIELYTISDKKLVARLQTSHGILNFVKHNPNEIIAIGKNSFIFYFRVDETQSGFSAKPLMQD